MSILVVGLSHRGTPVHLLERVVPAPETLDKVLVDAVACPHVAAAVVLSTCNRVEIYAEVERFHGGVEELAELLARHAGVSAAELTPHLYVRYEDGAVSHLFSVVCGLDSMVVGETQILGQAKAALRNAQDAETIGSVLNGVFQRALRVGKRAHTETDLGRAGRSVVSAALAQAEGVHGDLAGRTALVVGAGSMAALAATTLRRDHDAKVVVTNRTPSRARRIAEQVEGTAVPLADLRSALADADVLVSCTGAVGTVISAVDLAAAMRHRPDRPLVVCDLAMPRDVEIEAGQVAGVTLIDLGRLAETVDDGVATDVEAVRAIVAEEVADFVATRRAATVAPTVVALRSMAAEVVDAELRRLTARVPHLDDHSHSEVARTVRRVVDKLLHAPTIRVKELAEQTVETSYTDALRELFALDLSALEAFTSVEPVEPAQPDRSVQPGEPGGAP
ncbi:glutamyl-tRNA reductase [Actinopolymorpha cephalotaxi]|uniref:Glutamyl-tRNA reductase n=1 Tax=Actinopolymorpha cephalotaxi TaxID=504797 RepID=A0A1I2NK48_9ACTN|nr:glutamyl-tRNA reductase [Actinopolymorpha cephalotaxi]NYH85513.1 glutamyl-tRNA reductase [Actinopolymorpha cephalotaxi]SFG03169.1 glutamyl-tRNA reductase [Actinopolymorpha cephalotaxi]